MHQLNPNKLNLSKWTAIEPQNREKHFLVTTLIRDEAGVVQQCILEAVLTHREQTIDWQQLQDSQRWLQGWR
ncbi:TIGR02450 family Trp-rich protein [Amphritea sp. 1_MG-2023]|uniref:TIGR02450 family Trp-rich protein n=1 Tax=Amphritea sp. 1_MG-2023 TaxID=3062670 RepID=UPI0026E204F5|nr:TIGR02450 family Trp-rich protein [Amphritea sp. 1_MG-2023]MDO6563345.1 TIGR02450 family Trp-rich protein [Amphritea sp. 1_MG-2023]